mgnify:CR=1 FL=1
MREETERLSPDAYEALLRQNQELLRQVDRLSTLREVSLAVTSSLVLDEVLPLAGTIMQASLEARRIAIYEYDSAEDLFRAIYINQQGKDMLRGRLEGEQESDLSDYFDQAVAKCAVVFEQKADTLRAYVPLLVNQKLSGILFIERPRDFAAVMREDTAFFMQLAAPIAIAINNAQLYSLAVTDGLTRLYVRRYFDLRLNEEFAKARRYQRAFAVLMFDIDHFKKFNDTHGHQTGDAVLREFARLLRTNTRASDVCCRYGGEEMAVISPEIGLKEAGLLAEKVRAAVNKHAFRGAEGAMLSVTASVGVAAYLPEYAHARALVAAADTALYRAKEGGRNRVELAG